MKGIHCIFIVIVFSCCFSCKQKSNMFRLITRGESGIDFNNKITENDSINPISVTNIYNGGGVGIGDFNNDGLQDIYFTASLVSNKLYLNKGSMKFEDITKTAGVSGDGKWCRGVAVVDINNDGWMDMYVCASMDPNSEKRKNILYMNQGLDKNKIPVFKDMAADYGLDDTTYSTMANFFDYDNDGDLDVYITANQMVPKINPAMFKIKVTDGSFPSTGRLYRNDMHNTLHHPVFTNVTKQAGVTIEGYGHAATIADINKDGWKDIFVTNDFISNDLLYINNHDGTFSDKAASYFKHTSANGMGQDVIDINNDGLSDIVELDMNPQDNYRKKMMLGPNSYHMYFFYDNYKYQWQYVRNSLQINLGPRVKANDSIGDPVFADAGFFSGMSQTDWSWTPLVADFNNDGLRDMIITNGFPKDVTDHDFIMFRKESSASTPLSITLAQIPQVKLHNYAFQNRGDCRFDEVTNSWGLEKVSFSNGAAYADLDNDGDLDMIVNNINDAASVYQNTLMDKTETSNHYLSVKLLGDSFNVNGLGAWIELYYGGNKQVYEQTPYRGYLSSIQLNPHFGFSGVTKIDSMIVKWPGGTQQLIKDVATDQTIQVIKKNATTNYNWNMPVLAQQTLFKEITDSLGIQYAHSQIDYIDFNIQRLLPHKFSEYGPSLAAGDVNGDGLDDIIVGGNSSFGASLLLQQTNGKFVQRSLIATNETGNEQFQDMGMILFDADNDGDLDLYIARGGYQSKPNTAPYQDQFLENDGRGNFTVSTAAIPTNYTSKSCVRAIDYDKDGDLDLFIAGRVEPWNYPKPVSSFIYRNDSNKDQIKFTDVTSQVAPVLNKVGLVCDALFTDFDNDGWTDLILAGEWMPVTFLKNNKGIFQNTTAASGIANQVGWWNTIAAADFDKDGDMDYIVGNLGENSFYKASLKHPVSIYAKDFDNNKSYDAFTSIYLPTSQDDTTIKEYPAPGRDDIVEQMVRIRSKYNTYNSYAKVTIEKLFTPEQMQGAQVLRATNFSSAYCRNDGNGKFTLSPLPVTAQLSALNGMVIDDFDTDGNTDILFNTNDYSTEVGTGRYDALNGLMLKGDGKGNFAAQSILQSGIYIPGNGKAMVKLRSNDDKYLVAAGQNRGRLKVFKLKNDIRNIAIQPNEISADILLTSGSKSRQEFYYGSSFLSQSSRFLTVDKNVHSVTIINNEGAKRVVTF